jgi:acetoin utilization protein AcuB
MHERRTRHLAVLRDARLVGILSERDLLEYRVALGFAESWRDYGVSGVMTRSPRTVGPTEAIEDVAGRLSGGRIGALPVIDADGALVGMLTVADVLGGAVTHAPRASRARTAADIMTPGPFTATPGESLLAASKRMSVHGIRHLPVVDDAGRVLGMLSERDVRTAVGDPERLTRAKAALALRVGDAMTASPLVVAEGQPLLALAEVFRDRHLGAVPVVDGTDRLVGIVSYVDTLHALASRPPVE